MNNPIIYKFDTLLADLIVSKPVTQRDAPYDESHKHSGMPIYYQKGDKVVRKSDGKILTVKSQQDDDLFFFEERALGVSKKHFTLHSRHNLKPFNPGDRFKVSSTYDDGSATNEIHTVAYQAGGKVFLADGSTGSYLDRYDCIPYEVDDGTVTAMIYVMKCKKNYYVFLNEIPMYRAPTFYWALGFADDLARPNNLKIIRGKIHKSVVEDIDRHYEIGFLRTYFN